MIIVMVFYMARDRFYVFARVWVSVRIMFRIMVSLKVFVRNSLSYRLKGKG